jgi:1-acyl-sn-glycerol-3-phosphate acyltransferase
LRIMKLLGVELERHGTPPLHGLLVCNHLSYLDVVLLAATRRQVFLLKSDVKSWPLIGALSSCAGTLYINQARRHDVAELQEPFSAVVEDGLPITLFPEGASSDGSTILPFYSSLLEPAAKRQWPATPCWINYSLDEGNVADDLCYSPDMPLLPHFLKLLSKKQIYATVAFGQPIARGMNRKEMAAVLHRKVSAIAAKHRQREISAPTFSPEEITSRAA